MLRKILIWAAGILAILVVLIVLFYAEEDWRGARDWATCQKELQAKGEILDLRQLCPPGKPEDDLSKVPIFAELFQKDSTNARLNHLGIYLEKSVNPNALPGGLTNLTRGKPVNLTSWQKYYRLAPEPWLPQQMGSPTQDVLMRLSKFDPELIEFDLGLNNQKAYWPLNYEKPDHVLSSNILSLLDDYQHAAGVLQLRSVAHLENGESEKAEADFYFIKRLVRSSFRSRSTIAALFANSIQNSGEAILWEGMRRHSWKDTQLSGMEKSMASIDFLKNYREELRFARSVSIHSLSFLERNQPIPVPYSPGKKLELDEMFLFIDLCPKGRIDQAKSYFCDEIQKRIDDIDLNRGTLDVALFAKDKKSLMVPFLNILSGIYDSGRYAAKGETYLRMGRLACFLERYYLKQGHYPETLDGLPDLPQHLNQEVLSEQPLHYQRKGNGYLLYSVGWDRIDHGGVCAGSKIVDGVTVNNVDYDWVWPSP